MSAPTPHYLLYSASAPGDADGSPGDWRFVLEALDGSAKVEVADSEPDIRGERLELLAVVRGLEALDQPSKVTLVTPSRYVSRGLSHGLSDWRQNDWQWERHGEMVPVKNRDLWQRVDRALGFHRVECRRWRFDSAHEPADAASGGGANSDTGPGRSNHRAGGPHIRFAKRRAPPEQEAELAYHSKFRLFRQRLLVVRRLIAAITERLSLRLRQIGSPLFRAPWLD
jgi:ribonuclease HI